MASSIGFKLNRSFRATHQTAEVTAGAFVAVELYSNPGNPIYVDSLTWGTQLTGADVTIVGYTPIRIMRGIRLRDDVAQATQLASSFEELYAGASQGGQAWGGFDGFDEPLELEAGYLYTVIVETPVLSAALTQPVIQYVTVKGRTVPDKPVESSPVVLRSGIAEPLPEGCTQVEG